MATTVESNNQPTRSTKTTADASNFAAWKNSAVLQHMKSAPRLVNLERAYQVMAKYRLDGLVASSPLNIYYLSSHCGITQLMGRPFTSFAFLPRDTNSEPTLVLPNFSLYHLDYRPTWMPKIQAYSNALYDGDGRILKDADGSIRATQSPSIWPMREAALNARDKTLLAIFAEYEGQLSASPIHALKRAVVEGGAAQGVIGFEDPRICTWLNDAGLNDLKAIDATNILKEIRMVKTETEIDILRLASQKNEDALNYAISLIQPGLPLSEIEAAHARRWGELGGRGKWVIANINGLNSGIVKAGDFMKLDSVGVYEGYHGDVGRTVSVGPPSDELAGRIAANTKASRLVYDAIRPGMRFADASKMFVDLMMQAGYRSMGAPHCVGLEHTDQPFMTLDDEQRPLGRDFTFEVGTVFTLDMPHNEIGWGTTHVEDMMVVRENGCEALSSMDTSLKIRPV